MKKYLLWGTLCLSTLSLPSCSSSSDEEQVEPIRRFHFREPITAWASTPDEVKAYMSGYSLSSESENKLIFEGKDSESSYLYAFSGTTHSLTYVVVAFSLDLREEVTLFLEQHYQQQGSKDGHSVYADENHATYIWVSEDDSIYLTYMSASNTGR